MDEENAKLLDRYVATFKELTKSGNWTVPQVISSLTNSYPEEIKFLFDLVDNPEDTEAEVLQQATTTKQKRYLAKFTFIRLDKTFLGINYSFEKAIESAAGKVHKFMLVAAQMKTKETDGLLPELCCSSSGLPDEELMQILEKLKQNGYEVVHESNRLVNAEYKIVYHCKIEVRGIAVFEADAMKKAQGYQEAAQKLKVFVREQFSQNVVKNTNVEEKVTPTKELVDDNTDVEVLNHPPSPATTSSYSDQLALLKSLLERGTSSRCTPVATSPKDSAISKLPDPIGMIPIPSTTVKVQDQVPTASNNDQNWIRSPSPPALIPNSPIPSPPSSPTFGSSSSDSASNAKNKLFIHCAQLVTLLNRFHKVYHPEKSPLQVMKEFLAQHRDMFTIMTHKDPTRPQTKYFITTVKAFNLDIFEGIDKMAHVSRELALVKQYQYLVELSRFWAHFRSAVNNEDDNKPQEDILDELLQHESATNLLKLSVYPPNALRRGHEQWKTNIRINNLLNVTFFGVSEGTSKRGAAKKAIDQLRLLLPVVRGGSGLIDTKTSSSSSSDWQGPQTKNRPSTSSSVTFTNRKFRKFSTISNRNTIVSSAGSTFN